MQGYKLSDEERERALTLYAEGQTLQEVGRTLSIAPETVRRIVAAAGGCRKRGYKPPRDNTPEPCGICPNCGNTAHLKNARFCAICGAQLLSKRDLVLKRLGDVLYTCRLYLPDKKQDETIDAIREAMDFLKLKED